jgi:hypothetical protein
MFDRKTARNKPFVITTMNEDEVRFKGRVSVGRCRLVRRGDGLICLLVCCKLLQLISKVEALARVDLYIAGGCTFVAAIVAGKHS